MTANALILAIMGVNMERITNSMIDRKVNYLNQLTGNPAEPYSTIDGKYKSNTGNYHISSAYGGVCLDQMCDGGGTRSVFSIGHIPKRDLYNRICAYVLGLEVSK